MNPLTGRFWSMDRYEGQHLNPLSLHKYLYGGSNPVSHLDPSGYAFIVSNLIYGREVHREIGLHFSAHAGEPFVDQRIDAILGLPRSSWTSSRPDLVDRSAGDVYEIKPAGSYVFGRAQLEFYLLQLNAFDPFRRKWYAGGEYSPPRVLPLDFGTFALVSGPIDGVILYSVVDLRLAAGICFQASVHTMKTHEGLIAVQASLRFAA